MKPLTRALLAFLILLPACESEEPRPPGAPSGASSPAAAATPVPSPAPTPPPLALSCQAAPRSGDTPLTVRFAAFPSGGTGTYDFLWNFGDGTTSTAPRPAHTYTTPGVHPARLTLTSGEQARHCERPITVTGVALPPAPPPSPGAGPPPDLVITIVSANGSLSYAPNPARARVGQRVLWRNADTMTHTATANGGAFDTGLVATGALSAPVAFGAPGTFPYFCGLHPDMTATLVVTP